MDEAVVNSPSNRLTLPTPEECFQLWERYHTPSHIRDHMRQVARVGSYLARRLNSVGEGVIVELVDRACLLHDTVRVTDWDTLSFELFPSKPTKKEIAAWEEQRRQYPSTIPHAEVNYRIFVEEYPELAECIRTHSIGHAPRVRGWEALVVNYADRRVAHDRIVSVQERLDEAYARYSATAQQPLEREPEIVEAIHRMERMIYDRLDEDPDDLHEHINESEQ